MALFTVDLEDWFHAIHPRPGKIIPRLEENTDFILSTLHFFEVKAIFYVLGCLLPGYDELIRRIRKEGHIIGSHGTAHFHKEKEGDPGDTSMRWMFKNHLGIDVKYYRSPYWDTTPMPFPPAGGFFFRLMPLPYLKWAVKTSSDFWIHPHDIDPGHPELDNRLLNWKRHVGLKTSRSKLEKLMRHITWDDPCQLANLQTKN